MYRDFEAEFESLLRMVEKTIAEYPDTRPARRDTKEIRSKEGIYPGVRFRWMDATGELSARSYLVLQDPVGITVEVQVSGTGRQRTCYLPDMGIIPYENGRWNPTNYVILVDVP